MTNREWYKDTQDDMLSCIVKVVPALCENTDCKNCLLLDECGGRANIKKLAEGNE